MLKQKNYIRLGDYLQEKGLIDESDIQAALATAKKKGGRRNGTRLSFCLAVRD